MKGDELQYVLDVLDPDTQIVIEADGGLHWLLTAQLNDEGQLVLTFDPQEANP